MDMLQLQTYAAPAPELPAERAAAWVLLGRGKMAMEQEIQRHDLALQAIVKDWHLMDLPTLTEAIKKYKVTFALLSSSRKNFTQYIDECKSQCMPVENSWKMENNATFASMEAKELSLRQAAIDGTKAANDKLAESAAFKTHLITEFQNLACDYRDKLAYIAHQAKVVCLQQKTPPDMVPKAINAAIAAMNVSAPRDMLRFERKLVTDTEAQAIYDALRKPDYQSIYNESVAALNSSFEMYANELQNADALVPVIETTFASDQAAQRTEDQAQQQAAVLYIQATADVTKVVPGVKPVTESLQIKRDPANKEWVAAIMSAFLEHFAICMEKVRVKKDKVDYTTLSIDRMATALDAANIQVIGLEYEKFSK